MTRTAKLDHIAVIFFLSIKYMTALVTILG